MTRSGMMRWETFAGRQRRQDVLENAELTHVGPGTPCGEYLRRVWQPVALSSELGDLPLKLRLLGEDLVLFRTKNGTLGLLDHQCCHRGTSLEFGIVTDVGISCCYHGWHYGIDGTILETPNDPTSRLTGTLRSTAYPTYEFKGIIFAYMGPSADVPEFPVLDVWQEPDTEMIPYSYHYPCNWLQIQENSQDPIHAVFLHTRSSGVQFSESQGAVPELDFVETPIGLIYVSTRRWKSNVHVRTVEVIMPNLTQGGAIWESAEDEKYFQRGSGTSWKVATDDTNTQVIGWRFFNDRVDPEGRGDKSRIGKDMVDSFGQLADDRPYEEHQRIPGDYDAMTSQRPIAVHALENLQSSDRGVVRFRRMVRQGIKAAKEGKQIVAPHASADGAVPTYTQDTVLPVTPAAKDDQLLVSEIGRQIAEINLKSAQFGSSRRAQEFARMVRELGY